MPNKKSKTWTKTRHKIITKIAYFFIYPFVRFKYGARIQKIAKSDKRQYLILFNHQTDYDQFFVGCAMRKPVYYVASEDLFSKGFISKLLKWAVAPIPIKKQTTDVRAVMNCIKVAKEGGHVALSPEGNRTYSGKTEHINSAICGLIKVLKLPVLFFKIENGYGVHPRWSDNTRKGKMRAHISRVMEKEEYQDLSEEKLYEIVKKELAVNEGCLSGEFHHKRKAEYLERAVYVCPYCGFSTFESHKNNITCKKCGLELEYLSTKQLKVIKNSSLEGAKPFPFEFFTEWYDYQSQYLNQTDLSLYYDKPLYEERAEVFKVELYKNKKKIEKNANLKLYGNRIEIFGKNGNLNFNFDDLSGVTVLGRNKVNIYSKNELWQIKGDKRFNGLKYVNVFYRYNNIKKGEDNGKLLFLGL